MNRRAPLDELLGDHFSRRDALAAGVAVRRLSAHDLRIRFRGARTRVRDSEMPGDRFEQAQGALLERCAEYLPVAPSGFAFSHATAARLHGLPLPARLTASDDLHVCVPPAVRAPRRPGVVGHGAQSVERMIVRGLPVVEPRLAWFQMAPALSVDELVVAGDGLVRRKRPLSTLAAIDELIGSSPRARGIRTARAAMLDIRAGTDSPPESEVRLILVRDGLPEPVIRHTVHDADGFFVGTPDLAYPDERIAIEYQGAGHREDRETFEDDIIRRELFRRAGWHVFLVTSRTLRRPGILAGEMRALLSERSVLR